MPGTVLCVLYLALSLGSPWKRRQLTRGWQPDPTVETCVVLSENGTMWCADDLALRQGVDPEDSY